MTRPVDTERPSKPYPSFPLTPHPVGQWAKKIRGKIHYFGPWSDPDASLERYLGVASDLHAGRQPKVSEDATAVKDLVNAYLRHQADKLSNGEIGGRHFEDCRRVLTAFGKAVGKDRPLTELRPSDFQAYRSRLAKRVGMRALAKSITTIKSMFTYGFDAELIDRPPRFGVVFRSPQANVARRHRNQAPNLFSPNEVRVVLKAASETEIPTPSFLKPIILLGINGGLGNTDVAMLPLSVVNLEDAILDYPRPKTGEPRVVPLWPESVAALQEWLQLRPTVKEQEHNDLLFLTPRGRPLVRQVTHTTETGTITRITNLDRVSHAFIDLLEALSLKRKRCGFYTLRHTFRTWADETKDHHAIFRIMGHSLPGMSGVYVEEVSLDRLRAVVEHVRHKLFEEDSTVILGS